MIQFKDIQHNNKMSIQINGNILRFGVEGSGMRFRTIFYNLDEVANNLNIEQKTLLYNLKNYLGCSVSYSPELSSISGEHSQRDLEKAFKSFIE